jgi:eukaryotic-like serine/threonine-protein kinase
VVPGLEERARNVPGFERNVLSVPSTESSQEGSGKTGDAARFQRVMDVFLMAVDRDQAGREEVVRRECGTDPTIAADVIAMLAAEPPRDASDGSKLASSAGSTDGSGSGELATGAGLKLGADAAMAELRDLERDAAAALRTLPIISGHYRIIRTLGEGGMGVVYLAEQSMPRRMVALKAIRAGLASRNVLTRFVREANILGRLQHPGIAQIYECGVLEEDDSGRAFIVLEYVDGATITQHAKQYGVSETEKLELLAQVCDAVHHAHLRGVIHRDLKPGNILVERRADQTACPKVLDFGVARLDDASSHTAVGGSLGHAMVGTPGYMSPEQLDGDAGSVDVTSDVYALGVVLYELLSGRRAFDVAGKPLAEAARLVRSAAPPRIESLSRGRRTDLETILAKAMHPDRTRRYQSAAALSDDVHAVLERRPIAARRDSALYVLGRLADRHRVVVTLGVLLLLAGIALVVSSSLLAQRNARLAKVAQAAQVAAETQSAQVQSLNTQLSDELATARIERGRAEGVAGRLRLAEELLWTEAVSNHSATAPRWALAELYQRIPVLWVVQGPTDATSMCTVRIDGSLRMIVGRAAGSMMVYNERGELVIEIAPVGGRITSIAPIANGRVVVGLHDGRAATLEVRDDAKPEFVRLPDSEPAAAKTPMLLHPRGVREVSVSADGRTFSLSGGDKSITVWRVGSPGEETTMLTRFTPHVDTLNSHTLSPNGDLVASAGHDVPQSIGEPRSVLRLTKVPDTLTNAATVAWSRERAWNDTAIRLAFSFWNDGEADSTGVPRLLVSRRDFRVSILNTQTDAEQILPRKLPYTIITVPQALESSRVLLLSEDTVLLGDLKTQQYMPVAKQEGRVISGVWMSPDTYVTLSDTGVLRAASVESQPALTRLTDFRGWCFSTDWSPSGERLAIGSTDGLLSIHDGVTSARVMALPVPIIRIRGLSWLRDNDRMVLGCQDGRVRVASLMKGSVVREFAAAQSEIYGLAVDPSEKLVAIGQWNRAIRVFDLESCTLVADLPKPERRVDDLAFSSDARVMVCSGYAGHVQVWNVTDWSAGETLSVGSMPWGVEFSRDGRLLLVSTYDGTVEVFDADTQRPQGQRFTHRGTIRAHQRLIPALAISPDGALFATGSEDGAVKVWDAQSLRNLFTTDLEAGLVVAVAFSPNGKKLAAATGGRLAAVLDLDALFVPVEAQRSFQSERIRHAENLEK